MPSGPRTAVSKTDCCINDRSETQSCKTLLAICPPPLKVVALKRSIPAAPLALVSKPVEPLELGDRERDAAHQVAAITGRLPPFRPGEIMRLGLRYRAGVHDVASAGETQLAIRMLK